MKRFLAVLFLVVMLHPLFSSTVSESEISNAFVAITDLGFISAANFISLNRQNFDSIAIRISSETSLPESALYNNADLSSFLPYYNTKKERTSFLSELLPTMDPIVKDRLLINRWEIGRASCRERV